jgi:hypothetical protein
MDHVKDGHFCNYGPKDVILLDNRLNTASGWFSNNDLVYPRYYEAFKDFIIKLKEDDMEGISKQLGPEKLAHFNKIWLVRILVIRKFKNYDEYAAFITNPQWSDSSADYDE